MSSGWDALAFAIALLSLVVGLSMLGAAVRSSGSVRLLGGSERSVRLWRGLAYCLGAVGIALSATAHVKYGDPSSSVGLALLTIAAVLNLVTRVNMQKGDREKG